jgi:hypothetical protein
MVIRTIALDLLHLPLNLTQNIAQHFAILNIIRRHNCPPKIVLLSFNVDNDLIEMHLIGGFEAMATNLVGIELSKLLAPAADRLVGDFNPPAEHHFLNVTVTQREALI